MYSLQTVKLVRVIKERSLPAKLVKALEDLRLDPKNYVFVDYDISCELGHRRYTDRICLKQEWEELKKNGYEIEYVDHDKIVSDNK